MVTSKRAIKTSVLADHGQTVVLGGLIADDTILSRQSIPVLGDIPYVGRLFRADRRRNEKRNLLVFIHPTIVGDSDDIRRISQQRYNQLYSLQLSMDKNGNFAKLPQNVSDIYTQQGINNSPYQKVPTATQQKTSAVTTPVATAQPPLQKKAVERSKNTVTTTTLHPASSQ